MCAFFIVYAETATYEIAPKPIEMDVARFAEGLKTLFPGIELNIVPEDNIPMKNTAVFFDHFNGYPDNGIGGELDRQNILFIEGNSSTVAVAKVVRLYRSLVPESYRLYVSADWAGEEGVFELLENASEADVVESVRRVENN